MSAAAVVLARRWPKRWYAFYLGAAAVGAARIFLMKHFLSDVLAGAALEALTVIPGWTLGRLGNSISWFLSIVPYELFFYIFLPPLLLDAGARIDYFLFKRALLQVLTAAFLVVGFTTAAMIPLLLYVLRLADRGWGWQHVALLGSMLASTDAVAIINVMKERGGPRRLRVLLEGESLLNDASSFTLFSIFLSYVLGTHGGGGVGADGKYKSSAPVGWSVLGAVIADMLKLALGGFLFGVAFGVVAHWILKFMRRHRAGIDQQVLLPGGDEAAIGEEIRRRASILGRNGGYLMAPAHIIQADVSMETVEHMIATVKSIAY